MNVVSWNILAERFYKGQMEWPARLQTIKDTLSGLDLICLQEVELASFEADFSDLLNSRKEMVYRKHFISKRRTNPIGNVTLWNSNRFESQNRSNIKACNSTSVIVCLKEKETNFTFTIFNLHLKAGLYSGIEIRVSQIKSCIRLTEGLRNVCFCGDFNDEIVEGRKIHEYLRKAGFTIEQSHKPTCIVEDQFYTFDYAISKGDLACVLQQEMIQDQIDTNISDHIPIYFCIKNKSSII